MKIADNIAVTHSVSRRDWTAQFPGNLVVYIAGLLACLYLLGFGSIKPLSILSFGGDSLATWNYAKSYIDGYGFRINPDLGFPGFQDNSFFPSFDFSYRAFLRIVGLFAEQAATSYYLMYLASATAMFAASTYALRSLGFQSWVSAAGAIVYVVSPFFVFRSLVHDFLALYYSVPLGAALALRLSLGAGVAPVRSRQSIGALVSLLAVATSGLYYAFFSLLFLCFTAVVTAIGKLTIRPVLFAVVASLIVLPVLVLTGFGTSIVDVVSGTIPTVQRVAGSQLVLGLSFAEATHLFADSARFKWIFDEYSAFAPYASTILGLHDWPGIFLTLVIFASPLISATVGMSPVKSSQWHTLIFMAAGCILFGIIYSMNGGLAYYFNLFVNPSIRATGRVIPFLSFFALVIALAATELAAEKFGRRGLLFCVTFALLAASMYPSIDGLAWKQRALSARFEPNVESVRKVLAAKDQAGLTTILQLPHAPWPEAALMRGFDVYSLQDYYILDRKRSGTKWSFGGTSTQASFVRTAAMLEAHKLRGLVGAAKDMGFDGALLEKQPYEAGELASLTDNLKADACIAYEDNLRILFSFKQCCALCTDQSGKSSDRNER